jgi:lipopolysaccharide export system permease protein
MQYASKPRRPADSIDSPRSKPVWELLRDPQPSHWPSCFGGWVLPLAALNLAVLAIPLSFVNPRAGRANNLLFALLLHDLQQLAQREPGLGRAGQDWLRIGVWAVHVGMFLLLIVLFYRRQNPLAWGRLRWR